MGSVVKAITKPFKSIAKALTGGSAAPQIITQAAPAPTAVAQPTVIQPQAESDTGSGESSERVKRRGKKSLTIRRTNVGGGSGLNV